MNIISAMLDLQKLSKTLFQTACKQVGFQAHFGNTLFIKLIIWFIKLDIGFEDEMLSL